MVLNDKLHDYQAEQITYMILYGENKLKKIRLESLTTISPMQISDLDDAKKAMDDARKGRKGNGEKAGKILSILKSGNIFDKDNECIGNSHVI